VRKEFKYREAGKNKSLIRNRFRGRTSCVVVAAAREAGSRTTRQAEGSGYDVAARKFGRLTGGPSVTSITLACDLVVKNEPERFIACVRSVTYLCDFLRNLTTVTAGECPTGRSTGSD
jgi:hypothetical protein